MILAVLTFVYFTCDAIAIVSGAIVLSMLLKGELFGNLAVVFLKSALATSVTGFLFRFGHHILPTHTVSVLTVLLSGIAILSWRKYRLAGVWRSVFAFASAMVLYLSVLLPIIQLFKRISPLAAVSLTQYDSGSVLILLTVLAVFIVLGIAVVRTCKEKPIHSYYFIARHR